MKIEDVGAIDVHSHFGPPHGGTPDPVITDHSVEKLLLNMGKANIVLSVNSSWYGLIPGESGFSARGNEMCVCEAERVSGVYVWTILDPHEPETFAQAEKLLTHPKVLGIKIHPQLHGYELMEYGDLLFSFAAKQGAPILGHAGAEGCMPEEYGYFANRYPEVTVIAAHLGCGFEPAPYIRALENNPAGNLYTDTSSSASIESDMLEHTVSRVGCEHILFGTDSQTYFSPCQRARIDKADLTDGEKLKILRENALRVFPKLQKAVAAAR